MDVAATSDPASGSVSAKAAPIERGRATTTAMKDDCSVPAMIGQAPNCEPAAWATPSVWTVAP